MKTSDKEIYGLLAIMCVLTFFLSTPIANGWEETPPPDYIERIAKGEKPGWLPPTIEDLTQGKVKIGDLITKDNVDLVKDYLTKTTYECVKKGMVLRMAVNLPPEDITPQFYWEATARNKGKAVMDENGTVYLKDGSPWPGGLPFPNPKTALEAMANTKFGRVNDDWYIPASRLLYVSKDGKIEKTADMNIWEVYATGREKIPPLGAIPGHENFQYRGMQSFTTPLELKGMGQLTLRYYDEYKDADEGFMYIPAFKRVIRVSATTWQDNVGGSDFTWADPSGLREPYAYWDFKSIDKKLMLLPEPTNPFPYILDDGKIHSEFEFDHGYSFPRLGWAVTPVIVVEGVPTVKHIYGKKVFYMYNPPYFSTGSIISAGDIYDRQQEMWKCQVELRHKITIDGIDYANTNWGIMMHDLQTGHCTVNPWKAVVNTDPVKLESINLTMLMQRGR